MPDPVPTCELRRDARVFRTLKRHGLSDDQKHKLFALGHKSYRAYQAKLLELAEAAGCRIGIWAKDRIEKDGP